MNTIITLWHLTACKISVSPFFLNWIKNEMILIVSLLMLPTLIQIDDKKKNHFIFDPVQKQREAN